MRLAIEMPKVTYEMETGIVQGWHKTVGDALAIGEIVADIETEKAVVELNSPATGTLVEIVHGAGDEVPVLMPIGWLETGD